MKVLVTGGAGFIGSHIVDGLRQHDVDVICLDSLDPGVYQSPPEDLRPDVEYCFSDLRYWEPDERFQDVEGIVHLAALGGVSRASRQFANVIGANVLGTARLLEAARNWQNLRHIIQASSFSIYGSNYTYQCPRCDTKMTGERQLSDLQANQFEVICPNCGEVAQILPIEEDAPANPLEAYGSSKYMQELCYRGFDSSDYTILRFSSVYGPRMRLHDGEATIIARIAGWIKNGISPTLFEDGLQIRDWVNVKDVVDAVVALFNGKEAPQTINVCSGVPSTLVGACENIADALNVECHPKVIGGFRPGDMRHCLGNPANLRNLIGRRPITFEEGSAMAFGEE